MKLISLFVYNLAVQAYGLSICLAAIWNPKARLWVNGRRHWQDALKKLTFTKPRRYWIHCASLGEFEQARPLIEQLKARQDAHIILTFFSPSGYEVRKQYSGADYVCYLPLDTAANAQHFINALQPTAVFFTKYDFWYHYLHTLSQKSVPVFLFSARFTDSHVFFRWYGALFRQMLGFFTKIFVQDTASQQLLQNIGIRSTIAPDTRFDRVLQIAAAPKVFPYLTAWIANRPALIAGSTWPADEALIIRLINTNVLENYLYIIAPHDISDERLNRLQQMIQVPTVRWSALATSPAHEARVLLIDSVGDLSSLYSYARLAYVGGGYGAGLHNILEAAVYGLPVIFGGEYENHVEARELVQCAGAVALAHPNDMEKTVTQLATDPQMYASMSSAALAYVLQKAGGTRLILGEVDEWL